MLLTSAIAISNLLCRRTNICEIAEPCLTSFEEPVFHAVALFKGKWHAIAGTIVGFGPKPLFNKEYRCYAMVLALPRCRFPGQLSQPL